MIKGVNLLQNPIEYDKYANENLIQALANLGQRVGIKGDGLAYNQFTFGDLISSVIDDKTYLSSDYLGYIRYTNYIVNSANQYQAVFGLCRHDKQTGALSDWRPVDINSNINNYLYFPNDLVFNIPLGGIEKYSKNSLCINNGNDLTFMLVGKIMGTNDNDEFNSVLYYYKFDINTNLLKYCAKISHYDSSSNGELFYMTSVVNKSYKESNYSDSSLSDVYEMNIHIFNSSDLPTLLAEQFLRSFNFSRYQQNAELPYSLIRTEFEDINELLNYNDDLTNNYDSNSPVAIIEQLPINSLRSLNTIELIYNSNNNEFLSINQSNYHEILNYYNNEYNLDLTQELFLLNEDCTNLYYNIFNYYNEKYYLDTRATFIKRILLKLYESISVGYLNKEYTLYIPLDYQFHYVCNSNDPMYIYYSTNTYVTYINLDNISLKDFWNNNKNLIFDYEDDISKVKTFNFEVNYNSSNTKLINFVNIRDVFTLPYINGNENWSINDTDSHIRATGKNAGNPNIIIIYNSHKDNNLENNAYTVLNAITNSDEINASVFNKTRFKVNPALFENIYDTDIICYAYIPEVTIDNIEYFKDSIILSISDLNCLDNESYITQYKGSYILTIWHLIYDDLRNKYYFKCINQLSQDYALALGSTVNLVNATNDNTIADLDDKDLLLLKAIVTDVAQQKLSVSTNNWLLIKNKQSEEYLTKLNNIGQYLNDLNAIIQYNDNVKINNNHIIYSQNNKYINTASSIKVTNSLYPKYTYSNLTLTNSTATKTITELKLLRSETVATRVSKVLVDNNTIENVESLIEDLQNTYKEVTREVTENIVIQKADKIRSNYNEFIFNSNVPTLDFAEIFNRNFNVLNRVNIVTLDSNGLMYNAYIGTSYDELDKSTLHIGSVDTNINIGSETLMDEIDKSNFNVHNKLSLDFNEIILNAKNKLFGSLPQVTQTIINGVEYNTVNINAVGNIGTPGSKSLFIQDTNNIMLKDIISERFYNANISNLNSSISEYKMSLNNLISTYLGISTSEFTSNRINILNVENLSSLFNQLYDNLDDNIDISTHNVVTLNSNTYYVFNESQNTIYLLFNKKILEKSNNLIINNKQKILYCDFNISILYFKSYDDNKNEILNIYISVK